MITLIFVFYLYLSYITHYYSHIILLQLLLVEREAGVKGPAICLKISWVRPEVTHVLEQPALLGGASARRFHTLPQVPHHANVVEEKHRVQLLPAVIAPVVVASVVLVPFEVELLLLVGLLSLG